MPLLIHIMSGAGAGYWDEVILMAPVIAMGVGLIALLVYAIRDTNKRQREGNRTGRSSKSVFQRELSGER